MDAHISYHNLSEPDRSIRLIKLQPSEPGDAEGLADVASDVLVCDIEEHFLGDSPAYTALSYVWGSPECDKEYIIVNGTQIHTSKTVENALRRLRFRQKVRWLWVDQLCINQVDEEEKSHQVHQMHHIYSEADQVIAWLGTGDESSDLICHLMRETGRFLRGSNYAALSRLYSGDKSQQSVDLDAAQQAFHRFCQRSYWARIWVMQEFADIIERYARKNTIDGLETLLRNIERVYTTPHDSYVQNLFTRRSIFKSGLADASSADSLLKVVATSLVLEADYNWVHATDPRDRIFALLNLAGDKDYFSTFPDYSLSVEEVYKETARKILQQGCVDLLMFCQTPKKITSLPSWVPDWSMAMLHPCSQPVWNTPFLASGGETSKPTFTDDDRVILEGIYVDKIKETGTAWDPNWLEPLDVAAATAYVNSIKEFCSRSPRVRVGDEPADAARIAINDGTIWFDTVPYPEWGIECTEAFRVAIGVSEASSETSSESDGHGSESDDLWYGDTLLRLHTRRSFLTSTGFVGVGPLDVQAGDEISVFLGGKTAYLVRPRDDDTYSLIGEAYVHGVMYGELLKGGFEERKVYSLR
ncbi:hypothetical protein NM208_g1161 [Fusarium decemcellulare]|uniref:Uncharacterized protein n=1 Tax=Fusarium decemcellulare TaxID=57161 RepID=A0ACC1SXD0_9HYPO|nr:hypothetical protein NM208_g1161 [Fusarium decemcellulare]